MCVLYEVQRYGIEFNLVYEKFYIVLTKLRLNALIRRRKGVKIKRWGFGVHFGGAFWKDI